MAWRHGKKIVQRAGGWVLPALLALVAFPASAAIDFQWDENPWPGPPGTVLSHTYTAIGNDNLVVTFSGNTGSLVGSGGAPLSPQSNVFLDPTGNNGEHNLFVRATGNFVAPYINISIDFDDLVGGRSAITDLNFSLYDIDANPATSWRDFIRIRGRLTDGTWAPPASVTGPGASPSWTYSENNAGTAGRVRGSQPNQPSSGPGSDNGTADVFFDQEITELQLRYRNLHDDGTNQWIGISNLLFSEVPEPGTFTLVGLGLVGLGVVGRRRR